MNLAFFGAAVVSCLGALVAAMDQFSDSTNVDGPIYWIIIFVALALFVLGFILGPTRGIREK